MKILAWVAVPLVVTLVAWVVYRIANRPSAPLTPKESMQAHQRFLQVLETPVPAPQQPRRSAAAGRLRR
ncbi:MAG: hypothetical protein QOF82_1977 [Frankiales bacterium]|jgi:hypothetical protein|nr:hypothetical protein [Frankiales bacterium]MDX6212890.1 hypothetical protein [Frankiales bacterium]MDX6221142.1 hypothetical protein [Frankiales bacterium]